MNRQEWLFDFHNPLKERFGAEFFRAVPRSPGVYLMRGPEDEILYVGKAKDLRARLNSYKLARGDATSRKVLRLIRLIRRIEWEEHPSEREALFRENELLRKLKPPFNVLNTHPESYTFIAIKPLPGELRFRLTNSPRRRSDLIYGAFKATGIVCTGYQALLRLIWVSSAHVDRFEFPQRLVARKSPLLYSVRFREEWVAAIKRFLDGRDREFLLLLTEQLLENVAIPPFVYHVIQEDLETVGKLYEHCLRRNHELKVAHGIRKRLIRQEEYDDLLVRELVRCGKVAAPGEKK